MTNPLQEFFSEFSSRNPQGHFHKVVLLNKEADLEWNALSREIPHLNRGWFELSHLNSQDRIDFTREFWLSKLPYHKELPTFLEQFFSSLEEILVYLTQHKFDDPYEVTMVYVKKGNAGFFRGSPPATESELVTLKEAFPDHVFPEDYLAFLQIHNGFRKATDVTGITPSRRMPETYTKFQEFLEDKDPVYSNFRPSVNPRTLIPFYESFGMPFFQCFWEQWHPANEMGNVYYEGVNNSLSDITSRKASPEMMAFPTFTDWLMFYLEGVV